MIGDYLCRVLLYVLAFLTKPIQQKYETADHWHCYRHCFGYLYPAYCTYKVVEAKDAAAIQKWCKYWWGFSACRLQRLRMRTGNERISDKATVQAYLGLVHHC